MVVRRSVCIERRIQPIPPSYASFCLSTFYKLLRQLARTWKADGTTTIGGESHFRARHFLRPKIKTGQTRPSFIRKQVSLSSMLAPRLPSHRGQSRETPSGSRPASTAASSRPPQTGHPARRRRPGTEASSRRSLRPGRSRRVSLVPCPNLA